MYIECKILGDDGEVPNCITDKMVDDYIQEITTSTIENRTTLVRCVLKNGFVLYEDSSCVDPHNYSEKIGKEICLCHIKSKIYTLLGFLLATAKNGKLR